MVTMMMIVRETMTMKTITSRVMTTTAAERKRRMKIHGCMAQRQVYTIAIMWCIC